MNETPNSIFENSPCPSEKELLAYVSRNLPNKEVRKIELHIATCPICSDMIEGLMNMKEPEKLDAISEDLIRQASSRKTPILRLAKPMIYAIAASLVILLGMLAIFRWIVPSEERSMVSQNDPTQSEEIVQPPLTPADTEVKVIEKEAAIVERKPKLESRETRESVFPVSEEELPEIIAEEAVQPTQDQPISLTSIRDSQEKPEVFVVDGVQEPLEEKASKESGFRLKKALQKPGDSSQWKALYELAVCLHQMGFDPYALYLLNQIPEEAGFTWYPEVHDLIRKISGN